MDWKMRSETQNGLVIDMFCRCLLAPGNHVISISTFLVGLSSPYFCPFSVEIFLFRLNHLTVLNQFSFDMLYYFHRFHQTERQVFTIIPKRSFFH